MTCDPTIECCCPMDKESIMLLSILLPIGIFLSILIPCLIRTYAKRAELKRMERDEMKRYQEIKRHLSGYVVCKGVPYGAVWVSQEYFQGKRSVLLNLSLLPDNWLQAIEHPRTVLTQFILDQLQMIIDMNTKPKSTGKGTSKGKDETEETGLMIGVAGIAPRRSYASMNSVRTCSRPGCQQCMWSEIAQATFGKMASKTSNNPNHAGYDQPDYKPSTMPFLDQCEGKKDTSDADGPKEPIKNVFNV